MITDTKTSLRFIPILDLFKNKIFSRPTFYEHVKSGKITMYKLGGRSFVDKEEFESNFQKVEIKKS